MCCMFLLTNSSIHVCCMFLLSESSIQVCCMFLLTKSSIHVSWLEIGACKIFVSQIMVFGVLDCLYPEGWHVPNIVLEL